MLRASTLIPLLILSAIVGLSVSPGCRSGSFARQKRGFVGRVVQTTIPCEGRDFVIQWGEAADGTLVFVAIHELEMIPGETMGIAEAVSDRGRKEVTIDTPEGPIEIPSRWKMFEKSRLGFRKTDKITSLQALRSFLRSKPKAISIDMLLEYERISKATEKKGETAASAPG